MTAELAIQNEKTLYALVDDLSAYHETLDMLTAQLAEPLPDDERADLERSRSQVFAAIEGIGAELAGKTDAIAVVLRRLAVERDYIHDERTRLKAKEQANERAEKWLREYVVSVMQRSGLKQLKTPTNTLFLRASDAVEIEDATKLPEQYWNAEVKLPLWLWRAMVAACAEPYRIEAEKVRVHAEPSASTIKKAIKSGLEVPGADLRLNTNLVCR